jgi:hypothetical protein
MYKTVSEIEFCNNTKVPFQIGMLVKHRSSGIIGLIMSINHMNNMFNAVCLYSGELQSGVWSIGDNFTGSHEYYEIYNGKITLYNMEVR